MRNLIFLHDLASKKVNVYQAITNGIGVKLVINRCGGGRLNNFETAQNFQRSLFFWKHAFSCRNSWLFSEVLLLRYGRFCHQMLSVVLLSQFTVPSARAAKPSVPFGGWYRA